MPISRFKDSGESIDDIAMQLNTHRSTLYRELSRNQGETGYEYQEAHEKAIERMTNVDENALKMTSEMIAIIESKLKLQWSPEQITGWLTRRDAGMAVSHETIYKYVWQNKKKGGCLYKELRHQGKKYNKRSSGKAGRGCIPGRIDISERPAIVEELGLEIEKSIQL